MPGRCGLPHPATGEMRTSGRLEAAGEPGGRSGTLAFMQTGLIHIELVKARKRP
jgi:hypothetical protein